MDIDLLDLIRAGLRKPRQERSTLSAPPLPLPLASILTEIDTALQTRLNYCALLTALTLPDICVGLTLKVDRFVNKSDFVTFVDTYAEARKLGIDGSDCYSLSGEIRSQSQRRRASELNSSIRGFHDPGR